MAFAILGSLSLSAIQAIGITRSKLSGMKNLKMMMMTMMMMRFLRTTLPFR